MSKPCITVLYFAKLAEQRGLSSEILDEYPTTGEQLYQSLAERYHFPLQQSQVRLAVNECFENWDYEIRSGDVMAFIPPVAGG